MREQVERLQQPRHRAARPLAARRRRARAAHRADRPRPSWPARSPASSRRLAASTAPTSSFDSAAEADRDRAATRSEWRRSCVSCSTTRCGTRPTGTGVVGFGRPRERARSARRSPTPGLGIRRQTMPHIFEPFFTSDDRAQGAGLGLAIARELAERMSGRARRCAPAGRDHLHAGAAGMTAARARLLACAARARRGCGGRRGDSSSGARAPRPTTTRVQVRQVSSSAADAERRQVRPAPHLPRRGAGRGHGDVAVRR